MNIAALLAAAPAPDRPALIFPASGAAAVTFRELDERAARLAAGLRGLGLKAGDRAVVLAPVSLNLYLTLIALFKLGTTAVFLDPGSGRRRLDRAAALAQAKAFVGTRVALWLKWSVPGLRRIPIALSASGNSPRSIDALIASNAPLERHVEVEPEAAALITFTGGSTGPAGPRGVLRTHRLLAAQHTVIGRVLPAQPEDVDMPAFPIVTLHNLASGITSVIPDFPFRRPQAVRPDRVLRQISAHGVKTASGSPAYWTPIAEHCRAENLTLPLRRILVGGAPAPPALLAKLGQAAPRAEVIVVYGSTEAEPVTLYHADDSLPTIAERVADGAGIPLGRPISEVCVAVFDAQRRELPPDGIGEIWVSGEHVARGYFASPAADASDKHRDAQGRPWHRMGDLGYRDRSGMLWLVGRLNSALDARESSLYPVPVEAAVETMPFVQRAALVGARLFVELCRGPTPRGWRTQVHELCAARGWLVDGIRLVRRMPVDARHNARIDYTRLRAQAD